MGTRTRPGAVPRFLGTAVARRARRREPRYRTPAIVRRSGRSDKPEKPTVPGQVLLLEAETRAPTPLFAIAGVTTDGSVLAVPTHAPLKDPLIGCAGAPSNLSRGGDQQKAARLAGPKAVHRHAWAERELPTGRGLEPVAFAIA